MRVVVQRVSEASVRVDEVVVAAIGAGVMILVGIEQGDTQQDVSWVAQKCTSMRIFNDQQGVMNLDMVQVGAEVLAVSQFTLHASTRKGNRPSYIRAAGRELALELYESFVELMSQGSGRPAQKGIFGADMKVALVNDGPVTIIVDSKLRE